MDSWIKAACMFQEQEGRRQFVRKYVHQLTQEAMQTEQKQSALQRLWPQIVTDMVRTAVLDMSDIDKYRKKCMEDLEKS